MAFNGPAGKTPILKPRSLALGRSFFCIAIPDAHAIAHPSSPADIDRLNPTLPVCFTAISKKVMLFVQQMVYHQSHCRFNSNGALPS
jgi:hypothetical protein